jgi:hypothetical protein
MAIDTTAERRSEPRVPADPFKRVEISIAGLSSIYLFSLRHLSETGLGILVQQSSDIVNHIKVGDILNMKYLAQKPEPAVEIKTQIKHITKIDAGRYRGHYTVGLKIIQ